jgi:transposase-like protein
MKDKIKKAAIVAEYLRGDVSYRELQAKYGNSLGALHKWIHQYQQGMEDKLINEEINKLVDQDLGEGMPTDVKTLQAELRKSRLHNKLLKEIITIAEEDLSTPITKKYGTRQS